MCIQNIDKLAILGNKCIVKSYTYSFICKCTILFFIPFLRHQSTDALPKYSPFLRQADSKPASIGLSSDLTSVPQR